MKWLMCALIIVALSVPASLDLYWNHYWKTYETGAIHGADWALVYASCMNQWPTDKAIKEMAHYVNNPHSLPCGWFKHFKYD